MSRRHHHDACDIYDAMVRTTVDLPQEVLDAARSIARDRGTTFSQTISELIRRGLGHAPGVTVDRSALTGLPVVRLGRTLTQDDVRSLDDDG